MKRHQDCQETRGHGTQEEVETTVFVQPGVKKVKEKICCSLQLPN